MHGAMLHYFMLHIKRNYLYDKLTEFSYFELSGNNIDNMCCDKSHANKSIKSERFVATVHCADTDEHSYKPCTCPTRGSVLHASGCLAR